MQNILRPKRTRSRGRVYVPGKFNGKSAGTPRARRASGIEIVGEVRPAGQNLVAASVQIKPSRSGEYKRLHQPWQDEAMANYDAFGECRYPTTFYSDTFSQVRLYAAKRNPRGTPDEIDDQAAMDALARVRDKSGGHSHILRSYGKLAFLAGDGYLTATGMSDEDDPEVWEYLSPQELRVDGSGNLVRVRGSSMDQQELTVSVGQGELSPGQMRAWRMWRPHPAHSLLADAPMRSVAGLFEELGLLEAAVRARVKSRLASAGILMIPEEISFPDETTAGDEDAERDIFTEKLIEHMQMPIENEGTSSAVVPFVLRAQSDYLALIRHLKLHDPNETYRETGLRLETIKRISIGLDIPPEILLGLSDSNHWTAWQVDESVAKAHIYPLATMFCDDLTSAYFRPYLKEAGVKGWQEMTVWFDATPIVVHPNRAQDAKDLHDRGELSGAALRFHTGFKDGEEMGEDEHREWLAVKLRNPLLLEDMPEAQPADQETRTGDDVVTEEPQTQPQFRVLKILGAAEFAVDRARMLAGNRAKRKAQSCPECLSLIDGMAAHSVVAALGPDLLAEIDLNPRLLVDGAADELVRTAIRLGLSAESAATLGQQVEAHAAKTLFGPDTSSLPAGFHQFVEQLAA